MYRLFKLCMRLARFVGQSVDFDGLGSAAEHLWTRAVPSLFLTALSPGLRPQCLAACPTQCLCLLQVMINY